MGADAGREIMDENRPAENDRGIDPHPTPDCGAGKRRPRRREPARTVGIGWHARKPDPSFRFQMRTTGPVPGLRRVVRKAACSSLVSIQPSRQRRGHATLRVCGGLLQPDCPAKSRSVGPYEKENDLRGQSLRGRQTTPTDIGRMNTAYYGGNSRLGSNVFGTRARTIPVAGLRRCRFDVSFNRMSPEGNARQLLCWTP